MNSRSTCPGHRRLGPEILMTYTFRIRVEYGEHLGDRVGDIAAQFV